MRTHTTYGPVLLAVAMLFGPVVASPAAAQQPIRIGASAAITGRDSVQGGYFREGYLLCQKHVNEKGGVLGRPIQLVIRDDTSEPPVAARLYEKLIAQDKVDAILGPYGSPMTEGVADVVEKHRKVMVAPGAGTTAIWEKGRRYLIMLLSPLESSTEGTIDLAARSGLKTIAVLGSTARPAIAKGALEIAKRKGLDVVVHEMFPAGTTDFSAILNKVKAARPEALVVGVPPADAIAITRQVRELDVNVKLYGVTPGAAYPDFQKELGKTADFIYAGSYWEPGLPYPGNPEFVAAYQKEFGRAPASNSAGAYAGCQLFVDAVRRAGTLDSDAVRGELLRLKTKTVFGDFAVDERGYQVAHKPVTVQWQDGKLILVWPDEAATGKPSFPTPPWSAR
jgi:branched-chain amino acid transport system substrate-binding protein